MPDRSSLALEEGGGSDWVLASLVVAAAVVSKRGTGKGILTLNFIEQLKVVDRLFIVSPSASSNRALLDRLGNMISEEDIYTDVNGTYICIQH